MDYDVACRLTAEKRECTSVPLVEVWWVVVGLSSILVHEDCILGCESEEMILDRPWREVEVMDELTEVNSGAGL